MQALTCYEHLNLSAKRFFVGDCIFYKALVISTLLWIKELSNERTTPKFISASRKNEEVGSIVLPSPFQMLACGLTR